MSVSPTHFDWQDMGGNVLVLNCHGALSATQREPLLEGLRHHLAVHGAVRAVVVDLSDVQMVDSAGVGALFQITTRMRERGGRVLVAGASRELQHLLDAVGLTRFATATLTLDDALTEIGHNPLHG